MDLSTFLAALFRSTEKANTMSKKIRERKKEELAVTKLAQRALLFLWTGCFQYPWEPADGFGVLKEPRETAGTTVSKEPRETAGRTQSKATWLKVQRGAGNCNKRLNSNYRQPGWTTITCKSQVMGTLRKSSRIFAEN